jgi:hypothetical protein
MLMKSLLSYKPVLWFLFLFNAAVAVVAGGAARATGYLVSPGALC